MKRLLTFLMLGLTCAGFGQNLLVQIISSHNRTVTSGPLSPPLQYLTQWLSSITNNTAVAEVGSNAAYVGASQIYLSSASDNITLSGVVATNNIQPYYDISKLGTNTIINSTFDSDTWWTKHSNWAIIDGAASANGSISGSISKNNFLTSSKYYMVELDVTALNAAGGDPSFRNAGGTVYGPYLLTTGHFKFTMYLPAGQTGVAVYCPASSTITIDNFIIKEAPIPPGTAVPYPFANLIRFRLAGNINGIMINDVLVYPASEGAGTTLHGISGSWADVTTTANMSWTNSASTNAFCFNLINGFTVNGTTNIPALLDGTLDAEGNAISNPGGYVHNGAEVSLVWANGTNTYAELLALGPITNGPIAHALYYTNTPSSTPDTFCNQSNGVWAVTGGKEVASYTYPDEGLFTLAGVDYTGFSDSGLDLTNAAPTFAYDVYEFTRVAYAEDPIVLSGGNQ